MAHMANNVAKAIGKALTGDFSGLLLVAAGAVAIGTMALIANTSAQKKDNEEKEKANQLQNDLANSNDELTETYKNLKNAFDTYDVALDKLDNCIKGTQEWKDALNEVNDAAMQVINNLPSNVNVADMYHRDKETGQIVLDQEKVSEVIDTTQIQKAASDFATSSGSYHSEMRRAQSEMTKIADNAMG